MSQICEYCGDEHDVTDTVYARISHGFGHANKETVKFCSVECRVWWRRRCSDEPGAWEQPGPTGYQSRFGRFRDDDDDDDHGEQLTNPSPGDLGAHDGQQPAEA